MDDYLTAETGVVAAATAAVFSPRVRGWLRRGAVYGLAGTLMAGDAARSFARGIERGMRDGNGAPAHESDAPIGASGETQADGSPA